MRLWYTLRYLVFIAGEVIAGSLRIARNAFSPRLRSRRSIIEYPLRCRTDLEVSVFASSITITPGTLVVALAGAEGETPATIYVHSLFTTDRAGVVADLRDMEDRLLLATRGKEASC